MYYKVCTFTAVPAHAYMHNLILLILYILLRYNIYLINTHNVWWLCTFCINFVATVVSTIADWNQLNPTFSKQLSYIVSFFVHQVLIDNIEEYAPIVYTPTVGLVCQNYSGLFRRPRGMYFSSEDRGEMMSMVYNWPADQVCIGSCPSY